MRLPTQAKREAGLVIGFEFWKLLGIGAWNLGFPSRVRRGGPYCPSTQAKIRGAQIVASLSTTNFGVEAASLPQVIFSFGTAPE
jgi:hypothetical protein